MRLLCVVAATVLVTSLLRVQTPPRAAHKTSASVLTRQYTDRRNGVSFRTPRTWKKGDAEPLDERDHAERNTTEPQLLLTKDPEPQAVFFGPPAGGNVNGLYFIYSVKSMASAATCDEFASKLTLYHDAKPRSVVFNGVQFAARTVSDGDPNSHRMVDSTLYSTFRSGLCYFFETTATSTDRENSSADMSDSERESEARRARSTPWNSIHACLLDIMRTVRIDPPART